MATKYILESRYPPDGEWGSRRTVGYLRMSLQLKNFCSHLLGHGWLFRLRQEDPDQRFGPWLGSPEIRERITNRLKRNDYGFTIFVNRKRDGKTLKIKKIRTADPIPNLGCHPEIEKAYYLLRKKFGPYGIRDGGLWYCRYVDGSYTVSRHGYLGEGWKGAAGDIFSSPDTMSELVKRAYFLRAECMAGRLKLDRIIVGQTYWHSVDGFRNGHYYSGVYHRHIHIEVWDGGACDP